MYGLDSSGLGKEDGLDKAGGQVKRDRLTILGKRAICVR